MAIEGFEITKASDVDLKLRKYRDNYNTKGQYLGFADIDKHYSMMLGTCTDWTGFPMSGENTGAYGVAYEHIEVLRLEALGIFS
ncbi:MAG: hypothetical protein RL737_183 [Bacteroidota bacterium]|jgi:hypothetical protein